MMLLDQVRRDYVQLRCDDPYFSCFLSSYQVVVVEWLYENYIREVVQLDTHAFLPSFLPIFFIALLRYIIIICYRFSPMVGDHHRLIEGVHRTYGTTETCGWRHHRGWLHDPQPVTCSTSLLASSVIHMSLVCFVALSFM
jgi:hypothetical protein